MWSYEEKEEDVGGGGAEGRRGGREEGEVHYDGQRKIIINFIEEIL